MANPTITTIQLHRDGEWVSAATLQALGDDRCRIDYLPEYMFGHEDPWPIAMGIPLAFRTDEFVEGPAGATVDRRPAPFLYDLVPQGKGRRFLVDLLKVSDHENLVMPLVMAGAFNPIGCLRITSAMDFYRQQAQANPDSATGQGFELDDVLHKSEEFLDHIALHAMLASGTTGVQGVAPKFLLTTDINNRWYADMALSDERAHEHWLLKLPRGKAENDRTVLRNEAAYLRLAAACGVRTNADPMLHGEVLFVRRFDRLVVDGHLHRLHQESLASICGMRGFGTIETQQVLLEGLRGVVSDPLGETIEFLKRDVLNLAMRNTDNHARNTAVQRLPDGSIQLTPLFDFAPMFLDDEFIPRGYHWRDAKGKRQETWTEILETLQVGDDERVQIAGALNAFSQELGRLPQMAADCGVDETVINQCLKSIERQAEQLQKLPSAAAPSSDGLRMQPHG